MGKSKPAAFSSCLLLNISHCNFTESARDSYVVTIFNPLSRPVVKFVRLPVVEEANYTVTDPDGNQLITQVVEIPEATKKIPGRSSAATHELVFMAENLPGLGFKSFYVSKVATESPPEDSPGRFVQISDSFVTNLDSLRLDIKQQFMYYKAGRGEGKYIFMPREVASAVSSNCTTEVFEGPLVIEHRQQCKSWMTQSIFSYRNQDFLEYRWTVGPLR